VVAAEARVAWPAVVRVAWPAAAQVVSPAEARAVKPAAAQVGWRAAAPAVSLADAAELRAGAAERAAVTWDVIRGCRRSPERLNPKSSSISPASAAIQSRRIPRVGLFRLTYQATSANLSSPLSQFIARLSLKRPNP